MIFDRQITSTKSDLTSVAGTVEIGHIAAEQIQELLKEKNGAVKGKVLQVLGDPGDPYTLDIQKGFEEKMKPFPDVKIISLPAMQWEASNAGTIVADQMLANPDIDLIFVPRRAPGGRGGRVAGGQGQEAGRRHARLLERRAGRPRPHPQGLGASRGRAAAVRTGGGASRCSPTRSSNKQEIKPGEYDVLGLNSTLTTEAWGPNIKIPGAAITKDQCRRTAVLGQHEGPMPTPIKPVE